MVGASVNTSRKREKLYMICQPAEGASVLAGVELQPSRIETRDVCKTLISLPF